MARDVMTAEIHCCRDDEDLAKAVRHMEELKIRRLPVIKIFRVDKWGICQVRLPCGMAAG
jgi:predicted transcriptional regulator